MNIVKQLGKAVIIGGLITVAQGSGMNTIAKVATEGFNGVKKLKLNDLLKG